MSRQIEKLSVFLPAYNEEANIKMYRNGRLLLLTMAPKTKRVQSPTNLPKKTKKSPSFTTHPIEVMVPPSKVVFMVANTLGFPSLTPTVSSILKKSAVSLKLRKKPGLIWSSVTTLNEKFPLLAF